MNWFVLKSDGIPYNLCLCTDNDIVSIFIRDREHNLFYGVEFNNRCNSSHICESLNTYINNSKNTDTKNSVNIIFTSHVGNILDYVGLFTVFDYEKLDTCSSFRLRLAPADGHVDELFSANEAIYASKTLIDLKYCKKS